MTRTIAEQVEDLEDLKRRVKNGARDFAIMLNGGAYTRYTISLRRTGEWVLKYHFTGTKEVLSEEQLFDGDYSNIGEALDKGALVELFG